MGALLLGSAGPGTNNGVLGPVLLGWELALLQCMAYCAAYFGPHSASEVGKRGRERTVAQQPSMQMHGVDKLASLNHVEGS